MTTMIYPSGGEVSTTRLRWVFWGEQTRLIATLETHD
jgi:hypothetical protein